jgi:hypothetical protein
LAQQEASTIIRDFLVGLHKSYLPNVEEMRKAMKVTGLSLSTVNQAVTKGKGSAITHGLLICYGLRIQPQTLAHYMPKFRKLLGGAEKHTALDEVLHKALRVYTVDEVIVSLELLLAKDKIERSLGLKNKPGRKPKN